MTDCNHSITSKDIDKLIDRYKEHYKPKQHTLYAGNVLDYQYDEPYHKTIGIYSMTITKPHKLLVNDIV